MDVNSRTELLSPRLERFKILLQCINEECQNAGTSLKFDPDLALSAKGGDHRISIINDIFRARNVMLRMEGKTEIPTVSEVVGKAMVPYKNIEQFIFIVLSQSMEAGWIARRRIIDDHSISIRDLHQVFQASGISFNFNTALLLGKQPETEPYRERLAEALTTVATLYRQGKIGKIFASATSAESEIPVISEVIEHIAYTDPRALISNIRARALNYPDGDFA